MYTFSLTLKPCWNGSTVEKVEIFCSMPASACPAEGPALFYLPETVTIPFADYEGFAVSDDAGPLQTAAVDIPTGIGQMKMTGLMFDRPVQGTLRWHYTVYPRVLPENYRSMPYFDFRAEEGGMNSAGLTFIIGPGLNEKFIFDLKYDLSEMPEGASAASSLGSGNLCKESNGQEIRFMFYAFGLLHAYESQNFGVYWFGDVPFEIAPVAERVGMLYEYMHVFFHDKGNGYRVFLRRDPFEKSGGGTAACRSFLSGYSEKTPVNMVEWFNVIAHEMVHNWTNMDDVPTGFATWYNEGTAEYYSVVLPLRAGLADVKTSAGYITEKAQRYFNSPYRETPDLELGKNYWSDMQCQSTPYGRGFTYLANVEAQLKRAGKGSIDEIASCHDQSDPMTEELWVSFLQERLGDAGVQEFRDMRAGKLLIPDPDSFDGLFSVTEGTVTVDGKEQNTWTWSVR